MPDVWWSLMLEIAWGMPTAQWHFTPDPKRPAMVCRWAQFQTVCHGLIQEKAWKNWLPHDTDSSIWHTDSAIWPERFSGRTRHISARVAMLLAESLPVQASPNLLIRFWIYRLNHAKLRRLRQQRASLSQCRQWRMRCDVKWSQWVMSESVSEWSELSEWGELS